MVFKGKTVAEAISAGLAYYSITEEQAEINVIAEEVKGLFGKVKKEAEVDVSIKLTGGSRAVQFLEGLFEKMGVSAKAELVSEGENVVINVITTNSSAVIGYRGEVLDALQALAGAVANIGNKNYKRVVVDCEGYREKREETLINLAKKLADKAVRLGRDVSLEPMNPYERRVIHSTLADSETVTTASEEPNRHVVIIPNEKKPYVKKFNDRNRGGNRNYGGRRDKNDRRGGNDRNRGNRSGFTSAAREPKKKPSMFGTYLGNSLKNEE